MYKINRTMAKEYTQSSSTIIINIIIAAAVIIIIIIVTSRSSFRYYSPLVCKHSKNRINVVKLLAYFGVGGLVLIFILCLIDPDRFGNKMYACERLTRAADSKVKVITYL